MSSIPEFFSTIALGFSEEFGAPYYAAVATWPGTPTWDNNGSISSPGTPVQSDCSVQVSAPTQAMRLDESFTQTDMRLLVLGSTLTGTLDTSAAITITEGPHAGTWALISVSGDPAGIGYACLGRKVV